MKKRAQITMESLLLYGAAILVVLLAIAALVYFGVLDLGKLLPEKCEFSGQFTCEEYKVTKPATGSATVQVVVVNNGAKSVDITGLNFVPTDSGQASCTATTISPAQTVPPGGKSTALSVTCGTMRASAGDRLAGKLYLKHGVSGGSLKTDAIGDLVATITLT